MSRQERSANGNNVTELEQSAGEPVGQLTHNLQVLDDNDHPLVPQTDHDYYDPGLMDGKSLLDTIGLSMEHDDYGTLLIGETGCGKNAALAELCSLTNRPMVRVNFGVDVTYGELVGHYAPDPNTGEDEPDFAFVDGLLKWAVEKGAVFIADELNAASGEATMPLHGILEERSKRELVVRETGEVIQPHPEFRFVATMNPTGYAGTKDLNQAFKDRFIPIEVDYMRDDDEVELIHEQEGLPKDEAQELVDLAGNLRRSLRQGDIMTPVSTRELLKIAALREMYSLQSSAHIVLGGVGRDSDQDIISSTIERKINDPSSEEMRGDLGGLDVTQ